MRILVLHSDIAPDAPPDEQDTLVQAEAVGRALQAQGHSAALASFVLDPAALSLLVENSQADLVFNLVESVWGRGVYAPLAPQMLSELGIAYTGSSAATIAVSTDKLLSKRMLRAANRPPRRGAKPQAGAEWKRPVAGS
jgi:D-alanine-D-alanine ligase